MHSRATSPETAGIVTPEMVEAEIIRLGSAPIAEVFLERLDELGELQTSQLATLYTDVRNALKKRTKELRRFPVFVEEREKNFDLEKETLERLKKIIDEVVKSGDYLGQGATAEVYSDPIEPSRCFKIIRNPDEYAKVNSVEREAALLSRIADINIGGIHAPRPHYWAMHPEYHVLVMDRFRAVNASFVISGESKMPPGFKLEESMSNLVAYMNAIHARGVYHRDLNPQNVMLDSITGTPYVIDFGKGGEVLGAEDPYTYHNPDINEEDRYPNDDIKVQELKNKLKKLSLK